LAWVACSDGQIYRVDWTQGETPDPTFQTSSRTAKALAVVPAAYAEDKEVLLVAESDSSNLMEVVAYQPVNGSQPKSNSLLTLKKSGSGLQLLETSEDGQVIAGAHQDSLFLGTLSVGAESLDQLQYEIFSFDCPDIITCIDLRLYARTGNRRSQVAADKVVDIIVGGARGSIYVYHDALTRVKAAGKSQLVKDGIQVQKYHWHRKAVHAVKWSRDGVYSSFHRASNAVADISQGTISYREVPRASLWSGRLTHRRRTSYPIFPGASRTLWFRPAGLPTSFIWMTIQP
jgi:NET1-associated nuclear protein 1 (U3 small nucleolar RNA-associated protein 17)